jgi:hypothetical protein
VFWWHNSGEILVTYKRTVNELRRKASLFWPKELSKKAFERSVIPLLLDTQDKFISFLGLPVHKIDTLLEFVDHSDLAPNLFLKHLVVLTDFGGEMLQRINQFYDVLFPDGTMEYKWGQERQLYRFKALPIKGQLTTARLNLDSKALLKKTPISDLTQDVIALLILGGICTDERAAAVLAKCTISQYLGDGAQLAKYVKQRYIWVSRVTSGSDANRLGQLAEQTVIKYLQDHLGIPDAIVKQGGTLPGVSHHDEKSRSQTATRFDIVVSKDNKYVGIEISFQVTTNSVIERKGREARAIFEQVEQAGHRIVYILDGAGNFQRRTALENLCTYSNCTIAFSREEFDVLCAFLREFLQE